MLGKGQTDTVYPPPSTKVGSVPYRQINAIEDAKADLETGNNPIDKSTPQKVSWNLSDLYVQTDQCRSTRNAWHGTYSWYAIAFVGGWLIRR